MSFEVRVTGCEVRVARGDDACGFVRVMRSPNRIEIEGGGILLSPVVGHPSSSTHSFHYFNVFGFHFQLQEYLHQITARTDPLLLQK